MSDRKTPLCPMRLHTAYWRQTQDGTYVLDESGCSCLGSRCAWWCRVDDNRAGWCGHMQDKRGMSWPDPAATKED